MHPDFEAFQTRFRTSELRVHATASWIWTVRPRQPTLGASVLSLDRYALELHELRPDEMADLAAMISVLERTMRAAFDYRIMNYLALMMVDRHVHFHVIPRYEGPREFASLTWRDEGWPRLPDVLGDQHGSEEVLHAVRDRLRAHLVT